MKQVEIFKYLRSYVNAKGQYEKRRQKQNYSCKVKMEGVGRSGVGLKAASLG